MDNHEMKKQILALVNDDKVFFPIAEDAFNTVDTDKSGFIDKDEFKKYNVDNSILENALKDIDDEDLHNKLKDLSVLFNCFNKV